MVVGGVVLVLSPKFSGTDDGNAAGTKNSNSLGANAQYLLGVLLGAVSSVLSTMPLKTWTPATDRLDIWTFAVLTTAYQLPLTIISTPFVYTLPGLGRSRVPLDRAGAVYRDGLRCIAGTGKGCQYAWLYTLGTVATSTGMTVFSYTLIREYSATMVAVVSAVSLPATVLVFNLPCFTNEPNWHWSLFVGTALVLAGNALYKFPTRKNQ